MCNYNIVAPTSGLYAELLGFDPANAGVIIGMTPVAVIGSSILYSWWSSYSYKSALLFASSSCVVGNIVYALALPCDSLLMALLGRLLTGFGSARVINRRYIADYYSIEDRTSGMADFVSASAFGMAVGPGVAAALSIVAPTGRSVRERDYEEEHPSLSFWTVETAPGYLMFVCWAIYLVLNYLYFEEPERAHHGAKKEKKEDATEKEKVEGDASVEMTGSVKTEETPLVNRSKGGGGATPAALAVPEAKPKRKPFRVNIPVATSLLLLFILKCVLEGLSSSTPIVSRYYFGWGVHASGIYLAAVASLMLPANFVVAHVSRRYDDRELIVASLLVMVVGILGFLDYGGDEEGEYSETRFIMGGFFIFVACNALEGPTMGLLSKTIPSSMARGTLNAGLLATEAGTIGRVMGDFWLSMAAFEGMETMLDRTFEPMGVMVLVTCFLTLWSYSYLQPRYDDDDDDDD